MARQVENMSLVHNHKLRECDFFILVIILFAL